MAVWDSEDIASDDETDVEDDFDDDDLEDDELDDDEVDDDDDLDDADDLDDDEVEDDDLDDADEDEIDFCVALYREDGEPVGVALDPKLANDFDGLLEHLQRIPGDAGALGLVSLDSEVLVAIRVRGPRHVQVLVSDIYYADTWPLVHDAADFLNLDPDSDDVPDEGPVGDLGMFADQGLAEMDIEAMFMDTDEMTSEDVAERIAQGIRLGPVFRKAVDDYWDLEEEDD